MDRLPRLLPWLLLLLAPALPRAGEPAADWVFRGGRVYTLDPRQPWAEAVAVRGDKIVYVGPAGGVVPYISPRTRVVDLGGRMVLPAFQDSHVHPVSGGIGYLSCALFDYKTKDEYVKAVKAYAASNPGKPWIRGDGWVLDAFAPSGIPSKELLDAVVKDRPVYLESSDGHSAWVNSRALQVAGINIPTDVVQMLPFAMVMLVLVIFARHSVLPPALGLPYVRGDR